VRVCLCTVYTALQRHERHGFGPYVRHCRSSITDVHSPNPLLFNCQCNRDSNSEYTQLVAVVNAQSWYLLPAQHTTFGILDKR